MNRIVVIFCVAISVCVSLTTGVALAQPNPGPGDYGDAPEGMLAYPSTGVDGWFPTCVGGPAGFIWHGDPGRGFPNLWWGFTVDSETDGNAGFCPLPPYERDECWGPFDNDGGLAIPDPFTLDPGNMVIPCGNVPPRSLGFTCEVLNLVPGGPFEANLQNTTGDPGFVNVLFDWNQDGAWGGGSPCPGGLTPEHAIVNLPVPPFYVGPLSGLHPGPIQVGPNPGYVWVRMTISPEFPQVPMPWNGEGIFDEGETEDYLLHVEAAPNSAEYGDAPENVVAYPNGILGEFPTCRVSGPAGFVVHNAPVSAWFGASVDTEPEGNLGFCPQPPYDEDECESSDGDAGLITPDPWSMDANAVVVACPTGSGARGWTECSRLSWGHDVDIAVTNNSSDDRYVNLVIDWGQDGRWDNSIFTCPNGTVGEEHVLVNFPVPSGFVGSLSQLSPPSFVSAAGEGWVWCRFTISDQPVAPGWDGSGSFGDGETEDYLIQLQPETSDVDQSDGGSLSGSDLNIVSVRPNPFRPSTQFELDVVESGQGTAIVYDHRGRIVTKMDLGKLPIGRHVASWDGRDAEGVAMASGVYFLRVDVGGRVAREKLVLAR